MTVPAAAGCPWPVDTSCCSTWADHSPEIQERSIALASATLYMLSGYRVGGCPVTVRPCRRERCGQYGWYGGWLSPVLYGGEWFNCACGLPDCSCTALSEVLLPPPVGWIDEVVEDGAVMPPADYRVDDGNKLVRLDGGQWPLCQDMAAPLTAAGTFGVTYLNSLPVDGLAAYAAGVLACEFAQACTGGKCRLPAGVTNIVRQGVSMTIQSGAFPGGLTGIREVDTWVALYNPYHRKWAPAVYSPDLPSFRGRVTTWQAP